MKKIIAIGLFIGLYCNVSWAETSNARLNIKSETTVKLDTVYIDLKNDPDFKFKNNLRWFQDSNLALFGIKKKTGELFMEPMFSQIESFVDHLSIVTFDDLQGAINDKGEIVIPFQYEELQTSSEGMIAFYENGLWGFFNTLGEMVIEPSFEYVGSFSDGLVLASKDNLFGYLNKKGKIAIPFQYDYASNFEDGQAQVEVRFQSFFINKKGVKIAD